MGGWALTLCLCSYDARFSRSVQVVAHAGVLRFGHGVGVCLLWGTPIAVTPPPVLTPLPPRLMGVPLFREGVGVHDGCPLAVAPPPLVWPPPLFVCPPPVGLHPLSMGAYTRAIGDDPIPQLHREEEP